MGRVTKQKPNEFRHIQLNTFGKRKDIGELTHGGEYIWQAHGTSGNSSNPLNEERKNRRRKGPPSPGGKRKG